MATDILLQKNVNDLVQKYVDHIQRDPEFYKEDEGYKYRAVATFRKHFYLESENLGKMLEKALSDSRNLIESGQYYPRRMLLQYAENDPDYVRTQLRKLLDGSGDIAQRVDGFIQNLNDHFEEEGEQSYFDYRFVSFFLAAYDPYNYMYVKFSEFNKVAEMVGKDPVRKGSDGERYKAFLEFAKQIRDVLKENNSFCKTHEKITESFDYKDPSYSWGTTDFLFRVARDFGPDFERETKENVKRNSKVLHNKEEEAEDMFSEEWIPESEKQKKQARDYKRE